MDRLGYEPVSELTPAEVEEAIARDRPEELLYAVISVALYAEDPIWAEDVCVRLAAHTHFNVRGNAILGFGHIARVHHQLTRERVQPIIEAAFADPDPYVRAHAEDAASDVSHFLGWSIRRSAPA
ncbi:MAG: hypothetical protein M3P51_16800 [Chloroflexota bacterium]|nr:hypothetical protein [Chloroflexota bacterium]